MIRFYAIISCRWWRNPESLALIMVTSLLAIGVGKLRDRKRTSAGKLHRNVTAGEKRPPPALVRRDTDADHASQAGTRKTRPGIGRIKDMGSAAVGITLVIAGSAWLAAIGQRLSFW
jgi:hypothetical protein